MAVKLILGRSNSGKTERCLRALAACQRAGRAALFLVPDQATYTMERRLAERMPGKGYTGIQVVGFSRLAYLVLQERGCKRAAVSELGRMLVLQRLLRQMESELTVLRKAAVQPHFSETVGTFIEECRSFCVSPAALQAVATTVSDPSLADKLQDISRVYEAYTRVLTARFGNADDLLTALAAEIKYAGFLQHIPVLVDGFQWFTPQQLQVLEQLEKYAGPLTVTLSLDGEHLASQAGETALFHRSYETYGALRRLFPHSEQICLPPRLTNGAARMAHAFFRPVPSVRSRATAGIHIWECTSKEAEIEGVAKKIIQLCRQGYRYKDFLLVVRTSEEYNQLAERIFSMYRIPLFSDYQRPMASHPIVETVVSLLQVFRTSWTYEALFQLLKSDLFPISRDDADALENYCLAYGIQGGQWLADKAWYDDGTDARTASGINRIRRQVRDLLLPCWQESRSSHTLQTWCTLLYTWLKRLQVPATLRRWRQEDADAGCPGEAKEHEQVWKELLAFLQEIVTLCGEEEMELEDFAVILEDGLKTLKFSLIPPTLDHVTLTSVERGYTLQGKTVFICGMNDGIFPKRNREEGLFHDGERQQLEKAGLCLAPGSRLRSLQEKYLFYLAVTRSLQEVYLTYALADESGAAREPSLWIRQLLERGYVDGVRMVSDGISPGEEAAAITSAEAAVRLLPGQLQPAVDGGEVAPVWWALYDQLLRTSQKQAVRQAVRGLFHTNVAAPLTASVVRRLFAPQGILHGSVTKFEQYGTCPFAFFARYGLQLEARQRYRFVAPDLGLLVHGALKYMGDALLREGKQWRDLEMRQIPEYCRQATEVTAPSVRQDILMSNAYFRHIKERLIQTLIRTVRRLREFSEVSNFQMKGLEIAFGGKNGVWEPLQFTLPSGGKVSISGQIDRLDMLQEGEISYVAVIDYKSGRKEPALQPVFLGLDLQLLTYMIVALRQLGEKAVPAAVLYCYVRDDKISADHMVTETEKMALFQKKSKMSGFFLDDGRTMRQLDTSMQAYSEFLNLRLKKDGSLSNAGNQMYTESGWSHMLAVVQRRLRQAAQKITEGDIAVRPVLWQHRMPCTYCLYHAVCRFDTAFGNTYRVCRTIGNEDLRDKIRVEGEGEDGMD